MVVVAKHVFFGEPEAFPVPEYAEVSGSSPANARSSAVT